MVPRTQYARKGDAHIAYQIVGEGNTFDIVLVSTWFSHVEARWDLPGYAHAERFDPDGVYVRRYIPELGTPDYPSPMVMAA